MIAVPYRKRRCKEHREMQPVCAREARPAPSPIIRSRPPLAPPRFILTTPSRYSDTILDVHLTCKPARDDATMLQMNVTFVPGHQVQPGQCFKRGSGLARLVEVCGAPVPASRHSRQDSIPERCDTADMPHSILHLWGQGAYVNSTAVSSRPDHRSIRPDLAIWDVRGNRRGRSLHRYNSAYAKARTNRTVIEHPDPPKCIEYRFADNHWPKASNRKQTDSAPCPAPNTCLFNQAFWFLEK
ncbi:hypothetical protein Landi51_00885 [Colletotrichum acutatum]